MVILQMLSKAENFSVKNSSGDAWRDDTGTEAFPKIINIFRFNREPDSAFGGKLVQKYRFFGATTVWELSLWEEP